MIKIVKELLESGAITQAVADQLTGEWTSHTKVLNDENKALRTEKEDLSKNYEKVLESKTQLDEQLAGLDDKIAQAKLDGKTEIATELEAERASKQELQTSLHSLQEANQGLKIETGVQKALAEFDMIDADVVATVVKQNVTIGENGELAYKSGDATLPLGEGVKAFFEAKPNLLKAQGDGGSGNDNNNNSGNTGKADLGGNTGERVSSIQKMIDDGEKK